MKIVNLIGFPLTIAPEGVTPITIPAGEWRAYAPQIGGAVPASPITVEGLGEIPTVYASVVTLDQCRIRKGQREFPFPGPLAGTIYLAPLPVRMAAIASGRVDVWGMGDLVDPERPEAGVRNLIRS
jgi:hypothetical protein